MSYCMKYPCCRANFKQKIQHVCCRSSTERFISCLTLLYHVPALINLVLWKASEDCFGLIDCIGSVSLSPRNWTRWKQISITARLATPALSFSLLQYTHPCPSSVDSTHGLGTSKDMEAKRLWNCMDPSQNIGLTWISDRVSKSFFMCVNHSPQRARWEIIHLKIRKFTNECRGVQWRQARILMFLINTPPF